MKTSCSVLALWIRRRVRGEALIFLLTVGAEAALILPPLRNGQDLEAVLAGSHWELAAGAGYVLLCLWVLYLCAAPGSRMAYTLARLSLHPFTHFLLRWLSLSAGFFAWWFLQTGPALLLCLSAQRLGPGGPQTALLAFYRNPLLHGLLPLAEGSVYLRNVLLCLALGASAAQGAEKGDLRLYLFTAAFGVLRFRVEPGETGQILMSMLLNIPVILVSAGLTAWREEEKRREPETESSEI